jgi:hypothetical protein
MFGTAELVLVVVIVILLFAVTRIPELRRRGPGGSAQDGPRSRTYIDRLLGPLPPRVRSDG